MWSYSYLKIGFTFRLLSLLLSQKLNGGIEICTQKLMYLNITELVSFINYFTKSFHFFHYWNYVMQVLKKGSLTAIATEARKIAILTGSGRIQSCNLHGELQRWWSIDCHQCVKVKFRFLGKIYHGQFFTFVKWQRNIVYVKATTLWLWLLNSKVQQNNEFTVYLFLMS